MDPYRGSFLQKIITIILKPIFYVVYYIGRLYFKFKKIDEKTKEEVPNGWRAWIDVEQPLR